MTEDDIATGWWLRMRTVFLLCFRAVPGRSAALIGCQLAANLSGLASIYMIRLITDAALRGQAGQAVIAAAVMAGTATLTALFGRGYLNLTTAVSERAGRHIDSELIRLTGHIPTIEHFERPRYADQLTLIRQERTALAGMLNATVLNLRVAVSLIGAIVILAVADPILLALPVFGLPALLANQWSARISTQARERNAPTTRLRNHLYQVASSPSAGKELRVFGLTEELLRRHETASNELDRETARAARRSLLRTSGASAIFAAGYVGALLTVLVAAIGGRVSVGTLVLTISLAAMLNSQLSTAAQYTSYFQRVLSAAGRLLWLTAVAERATHRVADPIDPPARIEAGIDLREVGFRYPDTERAALTGITAQLAAGSVVALVGENGSGKTTLVKLLAGLYPPTEGTISADGLDLAGIDPAGWQRRVSPAFQDFVRFEFSLGQAVGLGDLDRIDDAPAITAALARAGAEELPEAVRDGLAGQLGTAWGGSDLSGGQWQKLALARALMRDRPLLLVFDEPTAALDALTEHALFERIAASARELPGDERPITLLVSHRLVTATMADLIIVLDEGRIVEQGDHDSLVEQGGRYAELHELHARAYR